MNKMNLSCGSRAIKYLMFLFNFLFVITGIVLIAIGATIKSTYKEYDTFLDEKYFSLPNMLIATGILIFIISFLGCYGAIKESWIILMAFSVLLGVIFIFEFSAGIAGYVLRDKTSEYLEKTFRHSIENYNNSQAIAKMWDLIQQEFECCGVEGDKDWSSKFGGVLPISCCPKKFGAIGDFHCNTQDASVTTTITTPTTTVAPTNATTPTSSPSPTSNISSPTNFSTATNKIDEIMPQALSRNLQLEKADGMSTTIPYPNGCKRAFGNYVKVHAVKIGVAGFVLAIIQIIGVAFSCHLARQLKNQYYST